MTIENFTKMITYIRKAYNSDYFLSDPEAQEIWYRFFEDADTDVVKLAVDRHISTSSKLPTIADITTHYVEVKHIKSRAMAEINNIFFGIVDSLPFDATKEDMGEYLSIVMKYNTNEERIRIARLVRDRSVAYYKQHMSDPDISLSTVIHGVIEDDEKRVQRVNQSS